VFELLGRLGLALLIIYVLTLFLGLFYLIYTTIRGATGVYSFDTSAFAYGYAVAVFAFSILIASLIYIKNR